MNRIRNLLVTAAVLALVPFAAFAQDDSEGVALTMTSVHIVTAGALVPLGGGNVAAFSPATDIGTVLLTYSTNAVETTEASRITAVAVLWTFPTGAITTSMPVLKATASAPIGDGAGTAADPVILISGANTPTAIAQTLVSGITNGDSRTTTVTFAVDASDAKILRGAYSTTVTFTLTASGV